MYYQNPNQGYQNPEGMYPPGGYNMNPQLQGYGSNMMPPRNNYQQNQAFNPNMMQYQNNYQPQAYEDYIDERLDKIDKQIKNLDTRLQKLESTSTNNDNIYMI